MKIMMSFLILITLLINACGVERVPISGLKSGNEVTTSYQLIRSLKEAPNNFSMTCIVGSNNMDDEFPHAFFSFYKNGSFQDIIAKTFYPPIKEIKRLKCNNHSSPFKCIFDLGEIIMDPATFRHTDVRPLVVNGIAKYHNIYFMSGKYTSRVKTMYTERPRYISCSGHLLSIYY